MNLEGAWGKSEGLSTIRTLKHKSLIIAHESALSKGKEMVGRAMFSTAVRGWKDGRKGGGSAGGEQGWKVAVRPTEPLGFAPLLPFLCTCKWQHLHSSTDAADPGSSSEHSGTFSVNCMYMVLLFRLFPLASASHASSSSPGVHASCSLSQPPVSFLLSLIVK